MPGTNGGTGQPISFRCSACRKKYGTREYHGEHTGRHGYREEVVLTGVTKEIKARRGGVRNTNTLRQYRCKHCGHVGSSRHVDLTR